MVLESQNTLTLYSVVEVCSIHTQIVVFAWIIFVAAVVVVGFARCPILCRRSVDLSEAIPNVPRLGSFATGYCSEQVLVTPSYSLGGGRRGG